AMETTVEEHPIVAEADVSMSEHVDSMVVDHTPDGNLVLLEEATPEDEPAVEEPDHLKSENESPAADIIQETANEAPPLPEDQVGVQQQEDVTGDTATEHPAPAVTEADVSMSEQAHTTVDHTSDGSPVLLKEATPEDEPETVAQDDR